MFGSSCGADVGVEVFEQDACLGPLASRCGYVDCLDSSCVDEPVDVYFGAVESVRCLLGREDDDGLGFSV